MFTKMDLKPVRVIASRVLHNTEAGDELRFDQDTGRYHKVESDGSCTQEVSFSPDTINKLKGTVVKEFNPIRVVVSGNDVSIYREKTSGKVYLPKEDVSNLIEELRKVVSE